MRPAPAASGSAHPGELPSSSRALRARRARPAASALSALLLAAALAAVGASVPSALGAQGAAPVYPGETWADVAGDEAALRALGWNPDALEDAWRFVRDSSTTTGLVVVDRGRVVLDFGDVDDLSYVASVRKSVLALLYGPWVENGTIDLSATVGELGMDDEGGLLDVERRATVEHLITARSGVYHPASNGGDSSADAPPRGSQQPGGYFLYNNWDFNAAGWVFERTTGVDIYDALEEQLAIPLGFQDWDREAQRKSGNLERSRYPAYHMWISTRDMARIGYLMLREGRWGDEQVVSRAWVRRIRGLETPLGEMNPRAPRGYLGYGTMWWVWDGPRARGPFEGAYTARGAWGQWITVLPAVDLVVALKTNSVYGRTTAWESWERLLERLLEAREEGR